LSPRRARFAPRAFGDARVNAVKSVEFGIRRYAGSIAELLIGRFRRSAITRRTAALSSVVSNANDVPPFPRASTLTRPRARRNAGSDANTRAPRSPSSSPSSKRRMTLRASGGDVRSARATSRRTATPEPSSPAPGETATES